MDTKRTSDRHTFDGDSGRVALGWAPFDALPAAEAASEWRRLRDEVDERERAARSEVVA